MAFRCFIILVLVGCLPGGNPIALSYEVMNVEAAGTIRGTVSLKGAAPPPKAYNLITFPDPEYCGRISDGKGWRLLKDFVVDERNHMQGVVMVLEGVAVGKPFALSIPKVEARDCQFLPFTTVVRNEHGIEIVNMDPVMHDIQAYETSLRHGTRVLFNSPLPFNRKHHRGNIHATHEHMPGKSMVHQFQLTKGRKTFVMQCGFHAYMESWAMAVENPYYTFTNDVGSYEISDIPQGTYRLRAWHPSVKQEKIQMVTVEPSETSNVDFTLDSPVGRWTAYTRQKSPRFTPAALGRPIHIEPLVELQRP